MIEAIYINAMLADAAYVDFLATHINPETGEIEPSAKELFTNPTNPPDGDPKGRGWTEEQFVWFQNNFSKRRGFIKLVTTSFLMA